jgi:hypothetical protein
LYKNFQKIKTFQEKRPLKFLSDNTEAYNQLFSMTELQDALRQTHDTAVGSDEIHYQMLKTPTRNLPWFTTGNFE